jgi:hypothetical protein
MSISVGIGLAQDLDGREAGLQAARQALNELGPVPPRLGILMVSHDYQAHDIVGGVVSLLGDTPLIGFSSTAGLSNGRQHTRSVILSVLTGDFEARAEWFPGYAQSSRETARMLLQLWKQRGNGGPAILFADGFAGDAQQLCDSIQGEAPLCVGALSVGNLQTGGNYQMAGNQAGAGAMAAAFLGSGVRLGIGQAHGWDPVGSQLRISRSRGFWLRALNGRPASEAYAELFGHPAQDWSFPPLSYLARLYPLGLSQGEELLVRAPVRVEADGSFRMNGPLREGTDAYLLVGSRHACLRAAEEAAQNAVRALGDAKPAFALVLVDVAWQLLLESTPGADVAAVSDVMGPSVPVAGAYTLGQIVPSANPRGPGGAVLPPRFLNQHMVVVAFGEATG